MTPQSYKALIFVLDLISYSKQSPTTSNTSSAFNNLAILGKNRQSKFSGILIIFACLSQVLWYLSGF